MIHNFTAENFYSIGDKIEVNFETSSSKIISKELYNKPTFDNKYVTKIGFIGGNNASGKSNVLRVPSFLRYLIVNSINDVNANDTMSFMQFAPYMYKKPTVLSVKFSVNNAIYDYYVEMSQYQILSEKLERRKMVNERATSSVIFSRKWEDGSYRINLSNELVNIKALVDLKQLVNNNKQASFISMFANFDQTDGVLRTVRGFWEGVVSNTQMSGIMEANNSMLLLSEKAIEDIYENKMLREKVSEILRKYDIGFDKFLMINEAGKERKNAIYAMNHVYNNHNINLTMNFESSGTQKLIILLEKILLALSFKEGVAIIDELDAFLHPDIFDEIVGLFMSEVTNPLGAQLIFSSQNYSILSQLDKQQIILTEKNDEGETEVWRLDEMENVRNDVNFYTRYLAGAYGAVPKIG